MPMSHRRGVTLREIDFPPDFDIGDKWVNSI